MNSEDADKLTKAAENAVKNVTEEYGTESAQCNRGVNNAFTELTGSTELANKNANDMVSTLETSANFEPVTSLEKAQEIANDGGIVIAGKKEETGSGHVVLVVPGEIVNSSFWKGKVPVVMDTGWGKRDKKIAISYSWVASDKSGVKFYHYNPQNGNQQNSNKSQVASKINYKSYLNMIR